MKLDEDMDQLVESIKERGIITPITLRSKEDGRYEIVSGHRRKKACELAGLETVKAEVREMSRDEAIRIWRLNLSKMKALISTPMPHTIITCLLQTQLKFQYPLPLK